QSRWQTRLAPPVRFAVHLLENIETLVSLPDDAPQPRLHERVPDGRVVLVGEALGLRDRLRDHRLQLRVALLVGARGMRHADAERGERDKQERAHARCRRLRPQAPSRVRMKASAPSAGNSVLALSRRWRYSSLPASFSRPASSSTSAFMGSLYLRPSWKM